MAPLAEAPGDTEMDTRGTQREAHSWGKVVLEVHRMGEFMLVAIFCLTSKTLHLGLKTTTTTTTNEEIRPGWRVVAHTQRQVDLCELKASLLYIASSRIVRATRLCLKNK